jgi:hypothetical protein
VLILKRSSCIVTASGIVTLRKLLYSAPVESGLSPKKLWRHLIRSTFYVTHHFFWCVFHVTCNIFVPCDILFQTVDWVHLMLHIKYELLRKRYELHCHSLHTPGYKPKISNVIKMRSAASEIKHVVTPSPYYVII